MIREKLLAEVALALIVSLIGCGGNVIKPVATPTFSATSQPSGSSQSNGSSTPSVSGTISPAKAWLGAGQTLQFTFVPNGTANVTVTWQLSCIPGDDCGTMSTTGLYSAPARLNSRDDLWVQVVVGSNVISAALISLMPVSVAVAPNTPHNVLAGGTESFAATVQYDLPNAGVTWALSGAGCVGAACGTLAPSSNTAVVYQAPAAPITGPVKLTATSVTDSAQQSSALFTVSNSPYALQGNYAFLINGWRRAGETDTIEAIAGQFEADGNGHIHGVWDANRGDAVAPAQPISGSYNIQPDGWGTLEIANGSGVWTYVIAVGAGGESARLTEATPVPVLAGDRRGASGYMVKQDASAFSWGAVQGERVIALSGEAQCCHIAALGRFTADESPILANTAMDLSWVLGDSDQSFPNPAAMGGTFGAPDTTSGRGVVSLWLTPSAGGAPDTYHFSYYVVSADTMLLVQTDTAGIRDSNLVPTLSGEIRRQDGAGGFSDTSLNAPLAFYLNNTSLSICGIFPAATAGLMNPNGAGAVTTIFDQNEGGDVLSNTIVNGTYAVDANGRVDLRAGIYTNFEGVKIWVHKALAYLLGTNRGYMMQGGLISGSIGAFEPQTDAPFSTASMAGTYLFYTAAPATADAQNDVGWLVLRADGTLTGTMYVNGGSGVAPYAVTGTFMVAENGSGTLLFDSPPPLYVNWGSYDFWMASRNKGAALIPGGEMSELFHLQRIGN